jgi:hypothetical protein
MLEILSIALNLSTWIVIFGMFVCIIKHRMAVKGTRVRYLAKTFLICLIIMYMVLQFVYALVQIQLADDLYTKGWHAAICAFVLAYYTWFLHHLLNEDDDDWFNDRWKKLKRWVKNVRSVRRLRPAYARFVVIKQKDCLVIGVG